MDLMDFSGLLFLLFLGALVCLIVGLIKPSIFHLQTRKKVLSILGGISFILFSTSITIAIVAPQKQEIQQVQQSQSNIQPESANPQLETSKSTKTDKAPISNQNPEARASINEKLDSYQLPLKSGQWRTCIANTINSLTNVELLQFQSWLFSLSPMVDEKEALVMIARKLNCPEPTIKIIPAKIEILKSWNGIGSKVIESQTFTIPENTDWRMILSWQNSPFNQNFGTDAEEIAFNRAGWDYGLVDYSETATITGTPIIVGFYSPSGNDFLSKSLWPSGEFDFLRIKAPEQSSWTLKIENIIEPEKTVIE